MKSLKRNNWTNKEIISILDGIKITPLDPNNESVLAYNGALEAAIETFMDFERNTDDPNEFGAKAYCIDENKVVPVTTMPKIN